MGEREGESERVRERDSERERERICLRWGGEEECYASHRKRTHDYRLRR